MAPSPRPWTVLGLCSYTHDSAAALIADGELVGFAEEERLLGSKHTKVYPSRAVAWLLAEAGLTADQVTTVGYNFCAGRYLGALAQIPQHLWQRATRERALARARSFATVASRTRARLRELGGRFPHARVHPMLHHRTHGLYAFACSGYDDAAVLVADSLGELQTTTIAHAQRTRAGGCNYRILDVVSDPASLGYAYGAVTEHLGWQRGDEEGTVMALAATWRTPTHGTPDSLRSTCCSWNGAGPFPAATPPGAAPLGTPATSIASNSWWTTTLGQPA
jgi:carbamoyltransferase